MEEKLISVLVPIYNVANYLSQCLESILAQTYKNLEIICVNDGSTDESLSVLQAYAAKDPRIVVIDKPNCGYGHTMNTALDRATGDYVAIVESDDYVEPDMMEALIRDAVNAEVDMVKTNFYRHTDEGDELAELFPNPPYNEVFALKDKSPEILMGGGNIWTGLYKRSFLLENGIRFNETSGASYQDTGFKLKTFICADSILLRKEAYYHYRVDNMNASIKSKEKVFCICDEVASVSDFVRTHMGQASEIKYWLEPFKFYIYNWNYERIDEKYKPLFHERMVKEIREDYENELLRKQDFSIEGWGELQWYFRDVDNRKIILFGAGHCGMINLRKLQRIGVPIAGFCDNDPDKWDIYFEGYPVVSPEQMVGQKQHPIFVIPNRPYKDDIIGQLEAIGAEYVVM